MKDALPAHIKARAIELSRTLGAYAVHQRLTEEGHKVGATTVYRWLKQATASGASRRVKTQRANAKTSDDSDVDEPVDDSEVLPQELDLDLETLDFRSLEALIKDVEAYRKQAKADDAVRTFSTLARLEVDIRERMHKLRPVRPPDPATDPANIQAREILFTSLKRMIEEAEKRVKG